MYPTHLIYQALGKPKIESEAYKGICAFCGMEIETGMPLKQAVSDTFTNFDLLTNRNASHVCECCYACLKDTRLRRMNFIATEQRITFFKRNEIERWLFNPPAVPFVIAITESMKKHNSFKARVNYSPRLFYVQKEDEQILFSPNKYKEIFESMNRLYSTFSKTAIATGEYQMNFIIKYGLNKFKRDEAIIRDARGTQQFELLLFAMNMNEENLKKLKERKSKAGG